MLQIRRSQERGLTQIDWLVSRHSFSFGWYHDPRHMGFGPLRVINDDWIAPSGGFDPHPHRDMEIISYLVEGSLAHKDSLGTGSVIGRGEIQMMTAGRGITHSEFNPSDKETTRLLQIWIQPHTRGLTPHYQQQPLPARAPGALTMLVSGTGEQGTLRINQDARIYGGQFEAGPGLVQSLEPTRRYWLQLVKGELEANGVKLAEGDALALVEEARLELAQASGAEVLFFDLP